MALLSPYAYDPFVDIPDVPGDPIPAPGTGAPPAPGPVGDPIVTEKADPIYVETPGGSGGGGGGGGFSPSGMPLIKIPGVPTFTAPVFKRPSVEDVLSSPGYGFRLSQGQQGIERSAAAKGLLRTGGTLKDISEYNQNFASAEYSQEFQRALNTFQTLYQGKKDEFAPLLAHWQMLSNAEIQKALAAYNRDTIWYNPNAGGGGGGTGPVILPPPNDPSGTWG